MPATKLKILVISNFYPPHHIGGYELGCKEVVEALKARGHDVRVLTSIYKVGKAQMDGDVWRSLHHSLGWQDSGYFQDLSRLLLAEWVNQKTFQRLVRSFRPDLVYVWNPKHVSMSLLALAEKIHLPICYFIFDNWLARFTPKRDHWIRMCHGDSQSLITKGSRPFLRGLAATAGLLTSGIPKDFRYAQFASEYLQKAAFQSGKIVTGSKVIHWGVNPRDFHCKSKHGNSLRLLYVGRIAKEKGVHTAIEAARILRDEHRQETLQLDIVGGTLQPAYLEQLRGMVRDYHLAQVVHFHDAVTRERLRSVYSDHDILIFPSIWDEPFGITLLEAMAPGMAVVGTATGGSGEILRGEINSLVFPPDNPAACAKQILRIFQSRTVFDKIRHAGRQDVEERFHLDSTIDHIEESLYAALEPRFHNHHQTLGQMSATNA